MAVVNCEMQVRLSVRYAGWGEDVLRWAPAGRCRSVTLTRARQVLIEGILFFCEHMWREREAADDTKCILYGEMGAFDGVDAIEYIERHQFVGEALLPIRKRKISQILIILLCLKAILRIIIAKSCNSTRFLVQQFSVPISYVYLFFDFHYNLYISYPQSAAIPLRCNYDKSTRCRNLVIRMNPSRFRMYQNA